MTNLEWLNNMKFYDKENGILRKVDIVNDLINEMLGISREERYEYRKVKALEIIAEELIKHNENSSCIVTALENLDTTLNRR